MSAQGGRSREAVTRIVKTQKFGMVLTLAHIAIYTGARIRSASTSARSATPSSATRSTAASIGACRATCGRSRTCSARSCTRRGWHSRIPTENRRMEFTSPLPGDLQQVLDELTEQIHGDRLYDPRVRG